MGSPTLSKTGEFASSGGDFEDEDSALREKELSMVESLASQPPLYMGTGYQLAAKEYMDPSAHNKRFYFTTKLGAPFPSYHSNPEPFFPPRWTSIRGSRLPVENITAPRIRLAPKELEDRHILYREMAATARRSVDAKPKPKVLNLSHQVLGDPYQLQALELMLSLNETVEVLNLNDNELDDISNLPLHNVRRLYLDQNHITSLLQVPPLPNCYELIITNNFITGYGGLDAERFPKLKKICVHGNPICTNLKHRAEILGLLPGLLFVDWFTRDRIKAMKNFSAKDVHRGFEDDDCC